MYAKLRRTAICALVGLSAVGGVSVSHAGYAWPADPPGFVRSGPWGQGYGYAVSANDQSFGKIVHQQNGLKYNVPGRTVTMPVSYRFAQNAPRFAAAAIFMNPAVRVGVGVASWLGVAGLVWDAVNKLWKIPNTEGLDIADGLEYGPVGRNIWFPTIKQACAGSFGYSGAPSGPNYEFLTPYNVPNAGGAVCHYPYKYKPTGDTGDATVNLEKRPGGCPVGWYSTPAGCVQTPPMKTVTQPEFEEILAPKPMPETVPWELPEHTPLPVEPSPGPWINPEPGTNPQHRPQFVPNGDPVPNPNYNPNADPTPENQPWIQPGVRLNPSPAPNEPFRTDVKPIDRPKPTNTPMPGPESEPSPNPANPNPNQGDKPKPEDKPGLCDEYPDILACSKPELDTPDGEIPKSNKEVSYTPDSLFGGGSCPADIYVTAGGQQLKAWDWQQSCSHIVTYFRPVMLFLGAIAAFLVLAGGTNE